MAQVRLARVIPSMHVHLCVASWLFSPRLSCPLLRPTVLLPALPDVHLSVQREVQVQPPVRPAWGPWSHPTMRHPSHRRRILNDYERHYRETIPSQCNSPYDVATCHFHTAIWLGKSQSILIQIERTCVPDAVCYRVHPLSPTTCWPAGPEFRTTHTNLVVLQEKLINDCWNVDGVELGQIRGQD